MGWWDHAERCSASTQSLQPQEATQTPSCIAQICAGTAGTKEWDMGGRQRQSPQASTAHFMLLLQPRLAPCHPWLGDANAARAPRAML